MALPAYPRERGSLADRSGTIASGGTSQPLALQNANRNYLFIQNLHATAPLWLGFGTAAVAGPGSIQVPAGADMTFEGNFVVTDSVAILGTTAGQGFTVKEG